MKTVTNMRTPPGEVTGYPDVGRCGEVDVGRRSTAFPRISSARFSGTCPHPVETPALSASDEVAPLPTFAATPALSHDRNRPSRRPRTLSAGRRPGPARSGQRRSCVTRRGSETRLAHDLGLAAHGEPEAREAAHGTASRALRDGGRPRKRRQCAAARRLPTFAGFVLIGASASRRASAAISDRRAPS